MRISLTLLPLLILVGSVAAIAGDVSGSHAPLEPFVKHQQELLAAGENPHAGHACALAKQGWFARRSSSPGMSIADMVDPTIRIAEDDTTHSYNSQHLDIQLWPDIAQGTYTGMVEMTAVANEELTSFFFHLKQATASSVLVNGQVTAHFVSGEQVIVSPAQTIAAGEEFTVEIEYSGTIFSNLFDGGMTYHNGTNTLFTFGEPYDTRRWLACYDFPFDKVTSRMRVTLPEEYELLSNGVVQEVVDNGDGTRTHDWLNMEQTSTYLLAFAAHPYVVLADDPAGQNDVPVNYWVYPDNEDDAWYDFNRTDDMIDYFEPLFGVYPFVKYDQAMAAIFSGWGAMEHQTATTYGHNLIDGSRYFENIVAHELGHQWWGDMVGPRTFANIWLNEGFASYSEALWAENFGDFNRLILLDSFRQQYFNEDNGNRYALYDPPPANLFGTTIYKKGAWVLHMLRWVVGDDAFFDGLTQYGQAYQYQTASVPDFQAEMESASGMDLDAFFDEWVYQAGYPEYLFSNFSVQPDGDTWSASLTVQQTQTNAPYFSTPLPIRFSGDGGEYHDARVEVDANPSQAVTVTGIEFEPDTFAFDPEQWLLCTFSVAGVDDPRTVTPETFQLSPAWPNPFNDGASVRLTLTRPGQVRARVFDTLGREVAVLANERFAPGEYRLAWQPEPGQASGTYLLRVETGQRVETRKLTLLR